MSRTSRWSLAATAALCCVVVGALLISRSSSPAAATSRGIDVQAATVTSAPRGGSSAVSLTLRNTTSHEIVLQSVTSPTTLHSMLEFDVNMCAGDTSMAPLPNIVVTPHSSQTLSTSGVGVMLMDARSPLVVGTTVPLNVSISEAGSPSLHFTLRARVVRPPRGLPQRMSMEDTGA